ncbi:MAG: hypothetical protein PVG65_01005 [Candidatus Thorarchaeota archaeon]|jgi:hypothetical protein
MTKQTDERTYLTFDFGTTRTRALSNKPFKEGVDQIVTDEIMTHTLDGSEKKVYVAYMPSCVLPIKAKNAQRVQDTKELWGEDAIQRAVSLDDVKVFREGLLYNAERLGKMYGHFLEAVPGKSDIFAVYSLPPAQLRPMHGVATLKDEENKKNLEEVRKLIKPEGRVKAIRGIAQNIAGSFMFYKEIYRDKKQTASIWDIGGGTGDGCLINFDPDEPYTIDFTRFPDLNPVVVMEDKGKNLAGDWRDEELRRSIQKEYGIDIGFQEARRINIEHSFVGEEEHSELEKYDLRGESGEVVKCDIRDLVKAPSERILRAMPGYIATLAGRAAIAVPKNIQASENIYLIGGVCATEGFGSNLEGILRQTFNNEKITVTTCSDNMFPVVRGEYIIAEELTQRNEWEKEEKKD